MISARHRALALKVSGVAGPQLGWPHRLRPEHELASSGRAAKTNNQLQLVSPVPDAICLFWYEPKGGEKKNRWKDPIFEFFFNSSMN